MTFRTTPSRTMKRGCIITGEFFIQIYRCDIVSQIKNLEGCEIYRFQMRSPIGNCKTLYLTVYSVVRLPEELEQCVRECTADLQLSNHALAKALKTKDEFMAAMSHELRTPLHRILGMVDVLQTTIK